MCVRSHLLLLVVVDYRSLLVGIFVCVWIVVSHTRNGREYKKKDASSSSSSSPHHTHNIFFFVCRFNRQTTTKEKKTNFVFEIRKHTFQSNKHFKTHTHTHLKKKKKWVNPGITTNSMILMTVTRRLRRSNFFEDTSITVTLIFQKKSTKKLYVIIHTYSLSPTLSHTHKNSKHQNRRRHTERDVNARKIPSQAVRN